MVEVIIDADEWWPVYSIGLDGVRVQADPEAVKRWRQAEIDFIKAQDEMEALYKAAHA